jgi:predicted cupin superfamily sugar epimerase
MNADEIIEHYKMEKHPEGGAFLETYRSNEKVQLNSFNGERNLSTGIYFLLKKDEFSAFHKIKSDELWHFYLGESLRIIEIDLDGKLKETILGRDILNGEKLQYTVPANHWFASIPNTNSDFSFVGCTVSPGFDFQDFELATYSNLSQIYPSHSEIIKELTYN